MFLIYIFLAEQDIKYNQYKNCTLNNKNKNLAKFLDNIKSDVNKSKNINQELQKISKNETKDKMYFKVNNNNNNYNNDQNLNKGLKSKE